MQINNGFFKNSKVALSKADTYDRELLYGTIKEQFNLLGIQPSDFSGKKVVLKLYACT